MAHSHLPSTNTSRSQGEAPLGPWEGTAPFGVQAERLSPSPAPWEVSFPQGSLCILALKPNSTVKCLIAQTGWGASQEFWKEVAGEEDISQMAQLHSPCPCLESSRCAYSSAGRHPTEHLLPGEKEVAGEEGNRGQDLLSGSLQGSMAFGLGKAQVLEGGYKEGT